jgi:transcriptional regulator with XRE-family HTH domain
MVRVPRGKVRTRALEGADSAGGSEVREAREKLGLTQAGLAAALGVSVLTVSRWENGHTRPAVRYLHAIGEIPNAPLPPPGAPAHRRLSPNGFVGRGREIAAILKALAEGRLVTLTGPGGVGKTRLATEAAAQSSPGGMAGVAWVDLAAVSAGEARSTVERTLASPRSPDRRAQSEAGVPRLVILDNCEHVVDEVGKICAEVLQTEGVSVVATSRRPLGVAGEQVISVPPLSLPLPGLGSGIPTSHSFQSVSR